MRPSIGNKGSMVQDDAGEISRDKAMALWKSFIESRGETLKVLRSPYGDWEWEKNGVT